MLRLKLFGQFDLSGPDGHLAPSSSKLSALLAYLAMAQKPVARDVLATVLWGSHFEEQARQNLRQALARMRKVIGADALAVTDSTVELLQAGVACDARLFDQLAQSAETGDLVKAAALLDGEFLAGIEVREPGFEDWLQQQRRRLDASACDCLVRLAAIELEQGRHAEAQQHAEAAIARDCYREDAHRAAILAMAGLGQRAGALRHFQGLEERLKRDLGTAPEPATAEVAARIRKGQGPEPPPAIPAGKPSIAILPFVNLSADAEQEYFADGIVEEIITALSQLRWLFVIARNSSFTYKGRTVDVRQVGRELGVRYVLEGSVRKAGNRVRIAGQLVDATDGATLWAGRSEGDLSDIFDLQDRVTLHIIAAIAPRLEEAEVERAKHKPTGSLDAYDCYLRGKAALHQWAAESSAEALRYFARAIDLDPEFAAAYGMAARCYTLRKAGGWMIDPAREEQEALRLAARAAELGRDDAVALGSAGFAIVYVGARHEDGEALAERALQLNPNFAWGWFFSGWIKVASGKSEAAIECLNRALQLSPNDPHALSMHLAIAEAHFFAGRYAEAVNVAEQASRVHPDRFAKLATIAAGYAKLGEVDKARPMVKRILEIEPHLNLRNLRHRFPIKRDEDFAIWQEALRLAGLPE